MRKRLRTEVKLLAAGILLLLAGCGQDKYSVGGTVTGLAGSGLLLRNNSGDDLAVTANGVFTFATRLNSGAHYDVTVASQPRDRSQTCVVAGGSGKSSGADVTSVAVSCTTNKYHVGGVVSGLGGSGLVLRNNGADDLAVNSNATFVFPAMVASGDRYDVQVLSQPTQAHTTQECTATDASGTVTNSDVATVRVVCRNVARFVYVQTNDGVRSLIYAFAIDAATGVLNAAPGNPINDPAGGTFSVTPDSRFAYLNAGNAGVIFGFSIDASSGALTPLPGSPFIAGAAPQGVAIEPAGNYAYAANRGEGNVSAYAIDRVTGDLAPLPGSPFPAGVSPGASFTDARGRFLYVLNSGSSDVSAYSIDAATGILTSVAGSPFPTGANPREITFTPDARFAYIRNVGDVSAYAVDGTSGALAQIGGSPFVLGSQPSALAIEPGGRYLYLSNYASSSNPPLYSSITVSGYAIDAVTGRLSEVPGSPYPICCSYTYVSVHPSGRFVFAPSGLTYPGTGTVYGFSIDAATGALSSLNGSPQYLGGKPMIYAIDASGRFGFMLDYGGAVEGRLVSTLIDPATGHLSAGPGSRLSWGPRALTIAY